MNIIKIASLFLLKLILILNVSETSAVIYPQAPPSHSIKSEETVAGDARKAKDAASLKAETKGREDCPIEPLRSEKASYPKVLRRQ